MTAFLTVFPFTPRVTVGCCGNEPPGSKTHDELDLADGDVGEPTPCCGLLVAVGLTGLWAGMFFH